MIRTAILLAGGLGTRLRSSVADLPKCMAPVDDIPFIDFVINYLKNEGIEHFIFSLGYKSESIIDYVNLHYPQLRSTYVIEDKPLGTGGAIQLACKSVEAENVIVVNGDTLFSIDLQALSHFHEMQLADCSVALKQMEDFDRYGAVEIAADNSISAFKEKQFCTSGTINGGVYALSVASLLEGYYPEIFSFEKEYLEKGTGNKRLFGLVHDNYFIDIGIPEDYSRFQQEYKIVLAKN